MAAVLAVLAGQCPFSTGWIRRGYMEGSFHKKILRHLYRGTKGITMASSTLRLASFTDSPSFLANHFSYVERHNDIKLEDTNQVLTLAIKKPH